MDGPGGWVSRYCTTCDIEYEPVVDECATCRGAALGLDLAVAGPPRPPRPTGSATIAVDHLDADARALLRLLLEAEGVPFESNAETLTVPADAVERVQDLVDGFAADGGPDAE